MNNLDKLSMITTEAAEIIMVKGGASIMQYGRILGFGVQGDMFSIYLSTWPLIMDAALTACLAGFCCDISRPCYLRTQPNSTRPNL